LIEILTTGIPNSVQDLGRPGFLSLGVGRSGAMDRIALEIANHLLGNQPGCAAVEVALFPFKLRFLSHIAFAVSGGGCVARLDDDPLPPFWARVARAGQILQLTPSPEGARAYVAFAGGVDVPIVLSSRSTDMKGRFGGFEGRGLKRGDQLPVRPAGLAEAGISVTGFGAAPRLLQNITETRESNVTRVHALPGAEQNEFTDEARDLFFASEWIVTKDANRTGYRLQGPMLTLKRPLELFSHGIVPGTVQVPSSGQPIIQLADANTCGGYPKIATVIEADLWRLAQTRSGGRIRFAETSREAAIDALRDQATQMQDLRETARLVRAI
jgi:5-oxoprolinase (ATP-hydrolysing) subunit C